MSDPTIYQRLACVKRTGHVFLIKPFETILDVTDKGDMITVTLKYFTLEERKGGFHVIETGLKLIGYVRNPTTDTWSKVPCTAPDPEPDVDFVRTYGASVTPALHRDRIDWATLCHRPGTESQPMDNEMRTRDYPELTTPKMVRHWNLRSI